MFVREGDSFDVTPSLSRSPVGSILINQQSLSSDFYAQPTIVQSGFTKTLELDPFLNQSVESGNQRM